MPDRLSTNESSGPPATAGGSDPNEDFYREGATVVFTARYHVRRGYCCNSGCRHCPFVNDDEIGALDSIA